MTYTTISGETWDQIAHKVYGEARYCDKIMDANREQLEYFIFPDGVVLNIPDLGSITSNTAKSDYPIWRALDG